MELPIPDSDSDSSYSSTSPAPSRVRWRGTSSTYLRLISEERGLASSIDQCRNQDLAVHLYNAHALKRRAREFWERKEKGVVLENTDEDNGQGWAPPKSWTAWPLAADEVPREGDVTGEEEFYELPAFKNADRGAFSTDLEEELLAVTLKEAGKRFEARPEAGSEVGEEDNADQIIEEHSDESDSGVRGKKSERKIQLRPTISSDDARSADILRPSIRHTLTKLDELLLALHHARQTCRNIRNRSAANTDDESVVSESPSKRGRGRPRKFANLALLQKDDLPLASVDPASLFRGKKTHIGRPQKVYPRLEDENQEDYLIRIARIQKKAVPSFASPRALSVSGSERRSLSISSSKSRKSPVKFSTEDELNIRRKQRLGLRDWSEILGTAALVGFSADVIERATKRCVDLFGEGMILNTLNEGSFKDEGDFTTTYLPDEIPDLGVQDANSVSSESSVEESRTKSSRPGKRKVDTQDDTDSWYCPIETCRKWKRVGFEFVAELRRHMKNAHKLTNKEIGELLDDELMDGAVHVDGFLEPMRYRRGVRGEGNSKRVRTKHVELRSEGSGESGETDDSSITESSDTGDEDGDGDEDDSTVS